MTMSSLSSRLVVGRGCDSATIVCVPSTDSPEIEVVNGNDNDKTPLGVTTTTTCDNNTTATSNSDDTESLSFLSFEDGEQDDDEKEKEKEDDMVVVRMLLEPEKNEQDLHPTILQGAIEVVPNGQRLEQYRTPSFILKKKHPLFRLESWQVANIPPSMVVENHHHDSHHLETKRRSSSSSSSSLSSTSTSSAMVMVVVLKSVRFCEAANLYYQGLPGGVTEAECHRCWYEKSDKFVFMEVATKAARAAFLVKRPSPVAAFWASLFGLGGGQQQHQHQHQKQDGEDSKTIATASTINSNSEFTTTTMPIKHPQLEFNEQAQVILNMFHACAKCAMNLTNANANNNNLFPAVFSSSPAPLRQEATTATTPTTATIMSFPEESSSQPPTPISHELRKALTQVYSDSPHVVGLEHYIVTPIRGEPEKLRNFILKEQCHCNNNTANSSTSTATATEATIGIAFKDNDKATLLCREDRLAHVSRCISQPSVIWAQEMAKAQAMAAAA